MSRAAFFDVDGTLLKIKSMQSFYYFFIESLEVDELKKKRLRYSFENYALENKNCSRLELNAWYYTLYKNVNREMLSELGQRWFKTLKQEQWIEPIVARLNIHRELGEKVVLVSGSSDFILQPIAEHLSVDDCLCSTVEVRDGVCTGDLMGAPVIGLHKMMAAKTWMQRNAIGPLKCVAYGDHISDADLLKFVGEAVAVNPDAALERLARICRWEIFNPSRLYSHTKIESTLC